MAISWRPARGRAACCCCATSSETSETGWTRAELEEHVHQEHSTFSWLLEPMLERAGFELERASYDPLGVRAGYLCRRRAD
jgi:hypothetical protein